MRNFFRKIWGYILYGIAKPIDVIFGGIIKGISFLVDKTKKLRQYLLPSMGCIIGILVFNPISMVFIAKTWLWIPLLFLFVFPLLGQSFVSFLDYWKYVICEYLYDKSHDYIKGTTKGQAFGNYKDKYRRKKSEEEEAERRRRYAEEEAARERRRQQQQEQWARIFEEFFGGFTGGTYTNYGGGYRPFGGQYGRTGSGSSYNPTFDFRQKYEESCRNLGLDFDTDEYQVKLAFRKMAKKYHPDVNKAPDAKEKFQKVNDAYEFLSKENIERYKRLRNL